MFVSTVVRRHLLALHILPRDTLTTIVYYHTRNQRSPSKKRCHAMRQRVVRSPRAVIAVFRGHRRSTRTQVIRGYFAASVSFPLVSEAAVNSRVCCHRQRLLSATKSSQKPVLRKRAIKPSIALHLLAVPSVSRGRSRGARRCATLTLPCVVGMNAIAEVFFFEPAGRVDVVGFAYHLPRSGS